MRSEQFLQIVEVKERLSSFWNCAAKFFFVTGCFDDILLFPLFDVVASTSVLPTDAIGGRYHSLEFLNARWWTLALHGGRKELVMETPGWRWRLRRQRGVTATSCFRVTSTRLHSRWARVRVRVVYLIVDAACPYRDQWRWRMSAKCGTQQQIVVFSRFASRAELVACGSCTAAATALL